MVWLLFVFFFKQKTAYEMRISDWSSDVCSSDLQVRRRYDALLKPTIFIVSRLLRADWRGARHHDDLVGGRKLHHLAWREQRAKIGRASCRERVCQYV